MEPDYGRARLADFELEPGVIHLNHGSYGAVPRSVSEAQAEWRRRIEANPTRFFRKEVADSLRRAAADAAAHLGGDGPDWAFVDNATTGVNAVLGSVALAPGDRILTTDQAYSAVRQALRHVARRTGAEIVAAPIEIPATGDDRIVEAVARHIDGRTRLAVFDHVTSRSAIVLPVARLASLCRDHAVPVLVDGAHAPGMVDLDVPGLGVDWYAANAHKWLCAPRGCGLLWCRPERQESTHPTVISHGYGAGFTAEFDWTGTRDPSAWLSITAALAYHDRLGGAGLRRRNRALAQAQGRQLAEMLETECAAPEAMGSAMVSVRLPGPAEATDRGAADLQATFGERFGVEVSTPAIGGHYWIRLSAHVYNEAADYAGLAEAVAGLA